MHTNAYPYPYYKLPLKQHSVIMATTLAPQHEGIDRNEPEDEREVTHVSMPKTQIVDVADGQIVVCTHTFAYTIMYHTHIHSHNTHTRQHVHINHTHRLIHMHIHIAHTHCTYIHTRITHTTHMRPTHTKYTHSHIHAIHWQLSSPIITEIGLRCDVCVALPNQCMQCTHGMDGIKEI